jgi:hypothetical protein
MAGRVVFGAGVLLLLAAALGSFLLVRPAEAPSVPVVVALPPSIPDPPLVAEQPEHLSAQLPPGQVAITLPLEPLRNVGGVVERGDHIDLYGFFPPRDDDESARTQLLLSNIRVHDLSQSREGQTILLVMSPQRALLVQGALQIGARPMITVRSPRSIPDQSSPTVLTDTDLVDWVNRQARQGSDRAG